MNETTDTPQTDGTDERRIQLDTSRMKSSYCNVCNGSTTADEVVLNFGVNQSWDRPDEDYLIQIEHRIMLSPRAAIRMRDVLVSLMEEYEARHGPIPE
ncbi:MAG: DUF3467 domain-containing protein [Paracoccaceae bacterium]